MQDTPRQAQLKHVQRTYGEPGLISRRLTALLWTGLVLGASTLGAFSQALAAPEGEASSARGGASTSQSPNNRPYAVDDGGPSMAAMADEAEELRQASATTIRRFHEVLDELLAEFGYDVKTGQLKDLKNLAIRRVDVSSAIPDTYREYTRLLVSERIRENSEVRLINCLPCSARTSKLIEGKIVITSPGTNVGELKTAADRLGIDTFMDIVLVYHSTHMVLAMQIFKADTHELTWARTYNSETIRSRYQKLAIDYSQVAKSRPGEDYEPEYRILVGAGGSMIPNTSGDSRDSSMIGVHLRSTERFNNRRSEFGMMTSLYASISSLQTPYSAGEDAGAEEGAEEAVEEEASSKPAPFNYALGIFAMYSHNFLGSVESYNEVRQGLHLALGPILTAGYLGPTVKVGWDFFFGRRFGLSFTGVYVGSSEILVDNEPTEVAGGIGGDVVISFNF